ncbi:MAG: DNA adenine methylase [Nitrososphaeria archaeon]
MVKKLKCLFPFHSGKMYQIPRILEILKQNRNMFDVVVEVFGGSAKVLWNIPKEWNKILVYNDIDKELCTTFRVLQDPVKREELKERLSLAFPVCQEFEDLRDGIIETKTDVDVAFKILYLRTYSLSGDGKNFMRLFTYHKVPHFTDQILKNFDIINSNWIIKNMDFRDIMKKYNKEEVLLYLNPPYHGWKYEKSYSHTFNENDLLDLKEGIDNHKGSYLMNLSVSSDVAEKMIEIFGKPNEVITYSFPQHSYQTKIKTWYFDFWYKFAKNEKKNVA